MTLYSALNRLLKKVPNRIPTGYWEQDGQYIFNTKPTPMNEGMAMPAQYVVTAAGEVYGTNPIQSNLDVSKMKRLPTPRKK